MAKNIILFLFIGFLTTYFCNIIESQFLSHYLHQNIISLTITLIAITSAVRAIILSKITEIKLINKDNDFTQTFKELKISIYEQVAMIIISILTIIIAESKLINPHIHTLSMFVCDSILAAVLFYSIYILYDTAVAVIDIFIALSTKK